jgi:hypothetical protein
MGHCIGGRFDALKANHPLVLDGMSRGDPRQAEGVTSRRITGESMRLLITALIVVFVC